MAPGAVLVLASSAKHTGPARAALLHARLLREAGRPVIFACHPHGTLERAAEEAGLTPHRGLHLATRGQIWTVPLDVSRIRRLVREQGCSLVLTYRSPEHLLAGLAVGGGAAVVRYVHAVNPLPEDPGSKGLSRGAWWLLRRRWTSRILCADPTGLPTLLHRVKRVLPEATQGGDWDEQIAAAREAGVEFVPGGVDTIHFSPDRGGIAVRAELGLDDSHVVIGLVSRVKPGRGHDLFLSAFARAAAQVPSLRAILIGNGSSRERKPVELQVEDLGIADCVAIFNPGGRYEEALAACDIGYLAHPGSGGGASAALELMSMARPMVLRPRGVLTMLPGAGGDCAWLTPEDPTSIEADWEVRATAEALVALATDPDRRMGMGLAARQRAETHFSRRVLQRQLIALADTASA